MTREELTHLLFREDPRIRELAIRNAGSLLSDARTDAETWAEGNGFDMGSEWSNERGEDIIELLKGTDARRIDVRDVEADEEDIPAYQFADGSLILALPAYWDFAAPLGEEDWYWIPADVLLRQA